MALVTKEQHFCQKTEGKVAMAAVLVATVGAGVWAYFHFSKKQVTKEEILSADGAKTNADEAKRIADELKAKAESNLKDMMGNMEKML